MPRTTKSTLTSESVRVRLRELIAGSGLSGAEVARRAEMSPSYLSNVLSGVKKSPEVATVARVLKALDRTWRDLD